MWLPCQLGTHASLPIAVTTNGPRPAFTDPAIALVAGSITTIRFSVIAGTQTLPPMIEGSPCGLFTVLIVAAIVFVCGSILTSAPGVVTQTASGEAAVHPAPPGTATRASTVFVAGSTRTTPALPATQTEPKAATTPVAAVTGTRATTLFFAGSIRSSSPAPKAVAHAAPYPKVAS